MNDPLLSHLLQELRADGLVGGTDDVVRAHRLAAALEGAPLDTLRTALRSTLAHDRAQQERFDAAFARVFAPSTNSTSTTTNSTTKAPSKLPPPSLRGLAAVLVGIAVCAVVVVVAQQPQNEAETPQPQQAPQGGADGAPPTTMPAPPPPASFAQVTRLPAVKMTPPPPPPRSPLRAIVAGLGLAVAAACLGLERRRRGQRQRYLPGPTTTRLRPPPVTPARLAERDVDDAAAELTFRTDERSDHLDVDATVDKSAAAAGRVVLQYRTSTAAPVWGVLLQDGPGAFAWRPLVDGVIAQLERAGVRLRRFSWEGDPGSVVDVDNGGRALSLAEVADRVDAVLVVGNAVVDDAAVAWLRALEQVPRRLWWNPRARSLWSPADRAIAAIAPMTGGLDAASLKGLLDGGDVDVDPGLWNAVERSPTATTTIDRLARALGDDAFRCLCACAVAGEPDATLALWLSTNATTSTTLATQLRLLSLPPFTARRWPDGLAPLLAARLKNDDKKAFERVERALLSLWKNNAPPPGSLAFLRWRLQVALAEARGGDDVGAATAELVELSQGVIGDEVRRAAGGVVDPLRLRLRRPPFVPAAAAAGACVVAALLLPSPSSAPAAPRVLGVAFVKVDWKDSIVMPTGVAGDQFVVWDNDGNVQRVIPGLPEDVRFVRSRVDRELMRAALLDDGGGVWLIDLPRNEVRNLYPSGQAVRAVDVALPLKGDDLLVLFEGGLLTDQRVDGTQPRATGVKTIAATWAGDAIYLDDKGALRHLGDPDVRGVFDVRAPFLAEGPTAGDVAFVDDGVLSVLEPRGRGVLLRAALPTPTEPFLVARLPSRPGALVFVADGDGIAALRLEPPTSACQELDPGAVALQFGGVSSSKNGWSIDVEQAIGGVMFGPFSGDYRLTVLLDPAASKNVDAIVIGTGDDVTPVMQLSLASDTGHVVPRRIEISSDVRHRAVDTWNASTQPASAREDPATQTFHQSLPPAQGGWPGLRERLIDEHAQVRWRSVRTDGLERDGDGVSLQVFATGLRGRLAIEAICLEGGAGPLRLERASNKVTDAASAAVRAEMFVNAQRPALNRCLQTLRARVPTASGRLTFRVSTAHVSVMIGPEDPTFRACVVDALRGFDANDEWTSNVAIVLIPDDEDPLLSGLEPSTRGNVEVKALTSTSLEGLKVPPRTKPYGDDDLREAARRRLAERQGSLRRCSVDVIPFQEHPGVVVRFGRDASGNLAGVVVADTTAGKIGGACLLGALDIVTGLDPAAPGTVDVPLEFTATTTTKQ